MKFPLQEVPSEPGLCVVRIKIYVVIPALVRTVIGKYFYFAELL